MNENDRSLSVNIDVLLAQLRTLIADARKEAKRTVDVIQVRTCWEIGRHIVEFEQGGQARAAYGKKLLSRLAESLTGEFGKGGLTIVICATCGRFIRYFPFGT